MTGPQHMQALKQANKVRLERFEIRREVRALPPAEGRALLSDLLMNPPACVQSLPMFELLQWPQRLGEAYAERFMHDARIGLDRTVAQTTERQRGALAACLHGFHQQIATDADFREWLASKENAA